MRRSKRFRALHNARKSAVKARTAAMNQIHQMLVTSPVDVREKYRQLAGKKLVTALASCRPSAKSGIGGVVLTALKCLAQRHQFLTAQAENLLVQIRDTVAAANPTLLSAKGVGPATAAQLLITAGGNPERLRSEASFAALCGTAPVPASSGKTVRYRLSRGGDRDANCALHTIALVRMSSDPRTREFVVAQRAKGRQTAELIRILKRAIAREVFRHLNQSHAVAGIEDLRQTMREKNILLRTVSTALDTYPIHVSRIEHGLYHDKDFTDRYRTWLDAA